MFKVNSFNFSDFSLENRVPWFPSEEAKLNTYRLNPDFDSKFDSETFIYDVFYNDSTLYILMPHYMDWSKIEYLLDNFFIEEKKLRDLPYSEYHNGVIVKFKIPCQFNKEINFGGRSFLPYDYSLSCYKNKKVLYTLQKDNQFHWIRDFINFYVENYKIDVVIIYDNRSELYDCDDLRRELQDLNVDVVVFSMPFKYGPVGYYTNHWSSIYLQSASLEHVRHSFCANSCILFNVDIDELIYYRDGVDVYNLLATSPTGALGLKGFWAYLPIEMRGADYRKIRHADHKYFENSPIEGRSNQKYICDLSRLCQNTTLNTHDILDDYERVSVLSIADSNSARFYHFSALSRWGNGSGWGDNRERFSNDVGIKKENFFFNL
jgi:hypothetical protein